jgi:SAM-dependent methyltransferase
MRGSYSHLYSKNSALWGDGPGRVARRVGRLPAGTVLDLGCGEGQNAIYLASLGWSVTGVDSDPIAIERFSSRTEIQRDRVIAVNSTVQAYLVENPPGNAFSIILACGLLHCLDDDCLALLLGAVASTPSGTVFCGSALTLPLPIPIDHGTGELVLRSVERYMDLFDTAGIRLDHSENGVIRESHDSESLPHCHSSFWFVASRT